jgi:uncharacterized protein
MKSHRLFALLMAMNTIAWFGQAQPTGTNSVSAHALANESWNSISNRWGSGSLARVRRAAEGGDVTAQFYLGDMYFNGNGVAKDQSEALKWIKKASDLKYAKAQMYLGWLYENGTGVPQDYAAAAKYYRLAAEQGNGRAQNNLGHFYQAGLGVPQDSAEAVKWYRQAAEQGDELGQSNLGWMYGHGVGVQRDYELAEKWMRLAAEQGNARLQFYYAEMLTDEFDKNGHQIANFAVAAEWYRKAADQGYAKAQYELAQLYNYGKLGDDQRPNCIPWYLKAAAQGSVEAQAKVGELSVYYPNSELLKNVDTAGALRQSAESGNLNAQFQLAQRYQKGDGVPRDLTEASKWMQKAAHNETPSSRVADAIYNLALMYEKGEGVLQDVSEAHNLFLQAAAEYQPDAMFRAGQMYEKGEGVPQDDHKAVELYSAKLHNYNNPDKYPNGFVEYGGPGAGAIERLLNLWTQGRGFPTSQDRAELGYREPGALIKYWGGLIKTAKAKFYAGEIYYQGKLVPKDIARAAEWFSKAAAQGSPEAMNRIGEMWAAGLNGAPDPKEAASWYRKGAAQGLAEAQYNLGVCFAKGEGVLPDNVEAWKWLQLAAGQQFPKAAEARDKVQSAMPADQLQTARAQADQFNSADKP